MLSGHLGCTCGAHPPVVYSVRKSPPSICILPDALIIGEASKRWEELHVEVHTKPHICIAENRGCIQLCIAKNSMHMLYLWCIKDAPRTKKRETFLCTLGVSSQTVWPAVPRKTYPAFFIFTYWRSIQFDNLLHTFAPLHLRCIRCIRCIWELRQFFNANPSLGLRRWAKRYGLLSNSQSDWNCTYWQSRKETRASHQPWNGGVTFGKCMACRFLM